MKRVRPRIDIVDRQARSGEAAVRVVEMGEEGVLGTYTRVGGNECQIQKGEGTRSNGNESHLKSSV